jgi:hypothetical protein
MMNSPSIGSFTCPARRGSSRHTSRVSGTVTAGALALAGFLQFGTLGMAAMIGGGSLLINTLEGNLLAPWFFNKPFGKCRRIKEEFHARAPR